MSWRNNRRQKLQGRLQLVSDIPMTKGSITSYRMEFRAMMAIPKIKRLKRKLKKSTGSEHEAVKRKLYDLKLSLFYDIPLKTECGKAKLFPFEEVRESAEESKNYERLRSDRDEEAIVRGLRAKVDEDLEHHAKDVLGISASGLTRKMRQIRNQDTESSFWFLHWTSSHKVASQTDDYKKLLEQTVDLCNKMATYATKLNEQLSYIRLCAYRNIYLGIELLNFDREVPVGGKSLHTVVSDKAVAVDIPDTSYLDNRPQFSQELIETAIAAGILGVGEIIEEGLDIDDLEGVGVAAAAIIGSLFIERWRVIEECSKQQLQITQEIDRLIGQMEKCKTWSARAIEVAHAVVEANKGYMAIYAPLRDKVFGRGERLTMEDVSMMTRVLNAYNKISISKV